MPVLLEALTAAQLDKLKLVGVIAGVLTGLGRLIGWLVELRKQKAMRDVPETKPPATFDHAPPRNSLDPAVFETRLKLEEARTDIQRLRWRLEEARRQLVVSARDNERLQDALTTERRRVEMLEVTLRHVRARAKVVDGIQDVTELVTPDEEATTWTSDASELLKTPMRPPARTRIVPV